MANTEGLLRQVADEVKEPVKKTLFEHEDPNIFGTHEIRRWYLKETEFAETDAVESAKEDAAADTMWIPSQVQRCSLITITRIIDRRVRSCILIF